MNAQRKRISILTFILGLALSPAVQAEEAMVQPKEAVACNEPFILIKGVVEKDTSMGMRGSLPDYGTFQLVDTFTKRRLGLVPPGFKETYIAQEAERLNRMVGKEIYACTREPGEMFTAPSGVEFQLVDVAEFILVPDKYLTKPPAAN